MIYKISPKISSVAENLSPQLSLALHVHCLLIYVALLYMLLFKKKTFISENLLCHELLVLFAVVVIKLSKDSIPINIEF